MSYYDDIVSDDEFFREAQKEQLTKDELLDQNFKKAQKSKKKRFGKEKKTNKKSFLKTGVLLLFIAIICLAVTNFLPWAYVKCDDSSGEKEVETFIYYGDDASDIEEEEITNIFNVPEVESTQDSSNFIGINFKDFNNAGDVLNLGFIFLTLLGIGFIVFQLLDRSKNMFKNGFMFFHTAFSCLVILTCFFLLFSLIRFFSVYPLLSYNNNFITSGNVFILFPVPMALAIILLIIIKAGFSVIKIYLKKMRTKVERNEDKNPLSFYGG